MQQQTLPTLSHPVLSLRQLRKAVGGAHRLQGLNRRSPEDRIDAVLARVLIAALEARDARTRRVAQALGWYAWQGCQEMKWQLWRVGAAELLEVIVALSPEASTLPRAKRLVRQLFPVPHQPSRAV
jgi:hypothetical protein